MIRRHRRTIRFKSGIIARNVLFIELVPEVLYELTYPKKEAIRKRIKVDSAELEPYEIVSPLRQNCQFTLQKMSIQIQRIQ